jgi:hypothetical protein
MLRRLFPVRLDNEGYRGRVAALWLFAGLVISLWSRPGAAGRVSE